MRKPILLLFVLLIQSLSLFGANFSTNSDSLRISSRQSSRIPRTRQAPPPLVLSNSAEPKAEAKRLYEEGMKLTDSGQFPQAVETFQAGYKTR
jgi:hypothetical protein